MENPAPFDLNNAIQRWRQNLATSPAFRAENLDELEAHLRDSVSALVAKGLSGEEAWLIATRRLGSTQSVTNEFCKINLETVIFKSSEGLEQLPPRHENHQIRKETKPSRITQIIAPLRSAASVVAGLFVSAALVLITELTLIRHSLVTPELLKVIYSFDLLAVLAGGYVTAYLAVRSPLRHALIVAGVAAALVTITTHVIERSWWQAVVPGLSVAVSVCLGALLRDWQRRNHRAKPSALVRYGDLSRKAGIVSVCCMVICILCLSSALLFPQVDLWLRSFSAWVLMGALVAGFAAISFAVAARVSRRLQIVAACR
jgi:hypothetical protein